jgi:hypothetical protein
MADLPITPTLPDLVRTLDRDGRAVLQAPPGAGKTTGVPLALRAAGETGRIVMLEPRRLATRAAAERMAAILGEPVGRTIGYTIRGERKVGAGTRIEVVTERILTRRLQADPELSGVSTVIFDEFHERALQADLGLALAWEVRGALRPDLRMLVMSATLDAAPVAALMDNAPILTSEGRTYDVETRWRDAPLPRGTRVETAAADTVVQAIAETEGGVLVFLPGEGEIRRTIAALNGRLPADCTVLPLYGALPAAGQRRAIAPAEAGRILGPVTAGNELSGIDLALVPGHDTSCAFEAIPRDRDSLLVSSGTWMLVGGVTEQPLLGEEAFALGVSNERTGTGGYRPNKTILGLWLLEQIIPSFDKRPQSDAEWNALIAAAEERPVPEVLLDTNDSALFNPEDMKAAIDGQLKAGGQRPPHDLPGYVALISASLGASLRDIARQFENILGREFGNIVIVGGGSKNRLLCQRMADFSRKTVTSYQLEASSVGNMAYQLLARGNLPSLEAFHDLIRPSLSTREYQPQ